MGKAGGIQFEQYLRSSVASEEKSNPSTAGKQAWWSKPVDLVDLCIMDDWKLVPASRQG